MSPTMQMAAPAVMYAPMMDAMDRHDYGVAKNRKVASTGGGRAWSEDEEVYLLQTRLQKMPYKHIAAHLKKTELACRLHHHQLSHGSNRRKRTSSASSSSSTGGHSPVLSVPSPIHEHQSLHQHHHSHNPHQHHGSLSRSASPPSSAYGSPSGLQLPRILANGTVDMSTSPRLPAILPKPSSMFGSPQRGGYPTPLPEPHGAGYHHRQLLPQQQPSHQLRLDCSALPPPAPSATESAWPPHHGHSSHHAQQHPATSAHVDMARLHAVYSAHRGSFWAAVAADYGSGARPEVLEQAWRGGSGVTGSVVSGGVGGVSAGQRPITPVGSPDDRVYGQGVERSSAGSDKTKISALLEVGEA